MKNEILNEINEIRIQMGLKILSENTLLLTEASPIVGFMEKYMLKGLLTDAEKILIRKFINPAVHGALSDAEKVELKKFLNSTSGTMFLADLRNEIENEADDALKLRMRGWLDNNLGKFSKTPIKPTGKGSVTGKSKEPNPFQDIENQIERHPETLTPADKKKILSQLRQASPKFKLYEQTVELIPGLSVNEKELLKLGFAKYANYTEAQLIEVMQELRYQVAAPYKKVLLKIMNRPGKSALWFISAIIAIKMIEMTVSGVGVVDKKWDQGLNWVSSLGEDKIENTKENVIKFMKEDPRFKDMNSQDEQFLSQNLDKSWKFEDAVGGFHYIDYIDGKFKFR